MACDVYRPAAIDQLKVVGEQIGVPVYAEPENKNVIGFANNAIKEAKGQGNDGLSSILLVVSPLMSR